MAIFLMSSLAIWKQLFVGIEIFHNDNFFEKVCGQLFGSECAIAWPIVSVMTIIFRVAQ